MTDFYDFKVNDLKGKPFDLAAATKGKVVIIVNVASKYAVATTQIR